MAEPVVHIRGDNGNWYKLDNNTWQNTGRPHEGTEHGERINTRTGDIEHYGGGS